MLAAVTGASRPLSCASLKQLRSREHAIGSALTQAAPDGRDPIRRVSDRDSLPGSRKARSHRKARWTEPYEISAARKAADTAGRSQKIGYNHRFHPAIMKARQIVDRRQLGR
jgi:hypothetical protein